MIPQTSWNDFNLSISCFGWWLHRPSFLGNVRIRFVGFGLVLHLICNLTNKKVNKSKSHRQTNLTFTLPLACGQKSWNCEFFSSHHPKYVLKNWKLFLEVREIIYQLSHMLKNITTSCKWGMHMICRECTRFGNFKRPKSIQFF